MRGKKAHSAHQYRQRQAQRQARIRRIGADPLEGLAEDALKRERKVYATGETVRLAQILKGVGGLYSLRLAAASDTPDEVTVALSPTAISWEAEQGLARGRGLLRMKGLRPLPGDWVWVAESGDPDAPWTLLDVLTRHNVFVRPPLANLERLVLVVSQAQPEPNPYLIDQMLYLAIHHDCRPILAWTKSDCVSPTDREAAQDLISQYEQAGIEQYLVGQAPAERVGREALKKAIYGHQVAFTGASGAGKSTLLNALLGEQCMETGSVSDKLGRGRHTTRHVEFFCWGEGLVADTPGFTQLSMGELDLPIESLIEAYPEFAPEVGACYFSSCTHTHEPGCAVKAAHEASPRYQRYKKLRSQS